MTTLRTINLGNYANDGTGDDLRTAFEKVNFNFDILKTEVSGAVNLGSGAGIFSQKNEVNLEFKSLISSDSSITFTSNPLTVDIHAKTSLISDSNPTLSADLSLNGHSIKAINGGDIQADVWGVNIPLLNSLVSILINSNTLNIDMGGLVSTTNPPPLDFGTFLAPAGITTVDFGTF